MLALPCELDGFRSERAGGTRTVCELSVARVKTPSGCAFRLREGDNSGWKLRLALDTTELDCEFFGVDVDREGPKTGVELGDGP